MPPHGLLTLKQESDQRECSGLVDGRAVDIQKGLSLWSCLSPRCWQPLNHGLLTAEMCWERLGAGGRQSFFTEIGQKCSSGDVFMPACCRGTCKSTI